MSRDGRAAAFLVADIGGTNARFALADSQGLGRQIVLPTKQFSTAQALLREALLVLGAPSPQAACLAVAGPVHEGAVTVTNGGGLRLAEASLAPLLGCPVRIVNDFYALALGVPLARRLERFGGGSGDEGVKALIGPGSGLGMAALVPQGDAWLPLASEGGHGDLAPGSPLESELLGILQRRHSHVSWETVLCGPGMVRLHEAVAELWGAPAEALQAHEISTRGVSLEDPVCHQTLEVFFRLAGRCCGQFGPDPMRHRRRLHWRRHHAAASGIRPHQPHAPPLRGTRRAKRIPPRPFPCLHCWIPRLACKAPCSACWRKIEPARWRRRSLRQPAQNNRHPPVAP